MAAFFMHGLRAFWVFSRTQLPYQLSLTLGSANLRGDAFWRFPASAEGRANG